MTTEYWVYQSLS